MAKAPLVTDAVRALIARVHQKYPKWKAPKVQKEVTYLLHKDNPKLPPGWPSLSTVQKVLALIRKNRLVDPKDKPWSLSSLAEYPIPPEALPTVMSSYKKRLAEDDVLPIREALWTARLYKLIDPPDLVRDWAFLYALDEMISELQGKPFDSTKLDLEMINNPYLARETQREIAIWDIAQKYGADPVKLKDLNLSIEQTEEIAKSGKCKKEAQHERSHTSEE
jgi:hypothetical protein